MPLDDAGMHRAGLAFVYRITPVLIATLLYGMYIAILCVATRGLIQRGFKQRVNIAILCILYIVFLFTTALWALEVAQLMGLDGILLYPNDLSTDAKFKSFYALIARETKITGVLFECQMIVGDILVIWRASAVCFDKKIYILLPLFWWGLMIVNMLVHSRYCQSGVASTNYAVVCKVTDISAPVLSILVNVSVMLLTIWQAWTLREMLMKAMRNKKKNKVFSLFVLLIESGTLYVIMLTADLLATSLVVGGPESIERMIDCIFGYATVQFVGIYPTLMLVILRESVWNAEEGTVQFTSVSRVHPSQLAHSRKTADTLHDAERNFVPISFAHIANPSPTSTGNHPGPGPVPGMPEYKEDYDVFRP